jgi:hypothetical protein
MAVFVGGDLVSVSCYHEAQGFTQPEGPAAGVTPAISAALVMLSAV